MAEAASGSGLVHLTEVDVPGASLAEPLEKQSVPALKRWILCRGIETPSNARKKQLLERLHQLQSSVKAQNQTLLQPSTWQVTLSSSATRFILIVTTI